MSNLILSVNELLDLSFDIGLNFDDKNIVSFNDFKKMEHENYPNDFVYLKDYKKYLESFTVFSTKEIKRLLETKEARWTNIYKNYLLIYIPEGFYRLQVTEETLQKEDYITFKSIKTLNCSWKDESIIN